MNKKGYTLVELLLGLVLIALLTYGMGVFIVKGIDAWKFLSERNSLQIEARRVSNQVLQKLRNIPSRASITTWNSDQIVFAGYDAVSHDFNITGSGSDYSINYNGSVLTDNATSDGLNFSYLEADGTAAETIDEILIISFVIKLTQDGETIRVRSAARLRRL